MIPYRVRSPIPQLRASFHSPRLRRRALIASVFSMGCLHLIIAIASVQQKSATFDEVAHVTAGYSYWKQNDYRLHPENGNLPQRWMALPLVAFSSRLNFPDLATDSWRSSDLWQVGDDFFHDSGNDFKWMLIAARSMIAIISVALCMLVFFWSRSLFGNAGGLISLVVCAFSPTILAHGRLATSDLFAAFFFAAAVWSIWELLHRLSVARLLAGTLAVSGLFLCKTSAVLILPMTLVMALFTLIPRQTISITSPRGRRYDLRSQLARRSYVLGVTVFIGLAAYTSVWAAYGFRYSASPGTDHAFYKFQDIKTVAQHSGTAGTAAMWLAEHRVLPEAYLYGTAFMAAHEGRAAFFNGEYETKGWRLFFPYCLAVKTPLAVFGLLALGMIALPRSARSSDNSSRMTIAYQLVPLVIAINIFWGVFLGTQLNIGHRHLLPTYPLMFVLAGAAAHWCRQRTKILAGTIALLLMWLVAESLASYPHYLSYFNPLVPREQAYRHLVDSSLDWGQDLPSLKKWLDANAPPKEPVFLGYFGSARPRSYGIEARSLPMLEYQQEPLELVPGTYCISATSLQSVYGELPGRWNAEYESYYQDLNRQFENELPSQGELRSQWDILRVRRLFASLRHREPDANAGYSVLIYRLSAPELEAALHGPPAELDRFSWETRRMLEELLNPSRNKKSI
ncbi:MAG: glycosyltransferase family 39 protein [Planctomycetales bacterium]|nr:glycosyltransferase family 39 protein [Planctomycetales bacterium]